MRGGVLRRKPAVVVTARAAQASSSSKGKVPTVCLNSGMAGSLAHGTLVGQSKISAEMHNAVDSRPGAAGEGADAYEKLRELGSGASGVVHLVKRRSDGALWVSKQIGLGGQPNGRGQAPSSDRQARISRAEREACLQEVRLMQSISHNHVIKFEASFVDEQSVVIIMEYASGGTVADLIKERRELHARFEEEDIWRCLLQVGLGLDAIHERGVIHRDIKAANILVDGEGDFKIGDLGIAVGTSFSVQHRIRTGKAGTIGCMAPEMCNDKPYDARADVWSLGCTIFEMASLVAAFPSNTGRFDSDIKEVILLQKKGNASTLRLPACFSPELSAAVLECLTLDQVERPTVRKLLLGSNVRPQVALAGLQLPFDKPEKEKAFSDAPRRERRLSDAQGLPTLVDSLGLGTPRSNAKGAKPAVGGRGLQPWYMGK